MLMANEAPLEKSTPEACRTALSLKLRAPEGSLRMPSSDGSCHEVTVKTEAHTILSKLEKGVTNVDRRFGRSHAKFGRPAPSPAPDAPPPNEAESSTSPSFSPGFNRRPARPLEGGASGNE
jgi:hypothetical protein